MASRVSIGLLHVSPTHEFNAYVACLPAEDIRKQLHVEISPPLKSHGRGLVHSMLGVCRQRPEFHPND